MCVRPDSRQRVCRVVSNARTRWNTVEPVNQDSASRAGFDDGRSRGRVSQKCIAVRLLLHFDLSKASEYSCHTEMATRMFPKTPNKHCRKPWFSDNATVLVQVPTITRHTRITLHPARSSLKPLDTGERLRLSSCLSDPCPNLVSFRKQTH